MTDLGFEVETNATANRGYDGSGGLAGCRDPCKVHLTPSFHFRKDSDLTDPFERKLVEIFHTTIAGPVDNLGDAVEVPVLHIK